MSKQSFKYGASIIAALGLLAAPTASSAATISPHQAKSMEFYRLLNQTRIKHHLPKLKINPRLAAGAEKYSRKMVDLHFYSHNDPKGGSFEKRLAASGYAPRGWVWGAGENLLWAPRADTSAQQILDIWMASPHHRENILIREWQDMGVGWVPGNPWGDLGSTWTLWMGEKIRF